MQLQKQKDGLEAVLKTKVMCVCFFRTRVLCFFFQVATLLQLRLIVSDKLRTTYDLLNTLQGLVLDEELIRWKREQQLSGNGAIFNSNLDTIQEW